MRKSGSAPSVATTGDGGLPLLNYSQISEWMKCRYRYELTTIRSIHSRAVIRPLEMGTAVHEGIAAAIRSASRHKALTRKAIRAAKDDAYEAIVHWMVKQVAIRGGENQLTEEETLELQVIRDEGTTICHMAIDALNLKRWRTLRTRDRQLLCETPVVIPFPGWGGFHGTMDWVVEDLENGGNFLIDHKVRKQFTPMESEEVNLQMPIYQKLLREAHGIDTIGTIMFQIHSRAPSKPTMNRNGTMSRARIATDWLTYKRTLEENGLDPADYVEEMQPKLDYEFNRMDIMYRAPEEVEAVWNEIVIPVAKDLKRARELGRGFYRSPGHMNCNGCGSRAFCLAELRGEDTEFLLQTRYIDLNNPAPRLIMSPNDLILAE